MLALAEIVLPPIALDSIYITGALLVIIGALYLAYDLLGRQHGPLQWLTLLVTCGLVELPCPWSSRSDHPLFLRISFRSCLYLTSYADWRSDGSIHELP